MYLISKMLSPTATAVGLLYRTSIDFKTYLWYNLKVEIRLKGRTT